MRILLYTRANCSHCRQLKQWLKARGQTFAEFDVQKSRRAAKALAQLGGRGVPLVVVGDEVVHGFDQKRLSRLLSESSSGKPASRPTTLKTRRA